MKPHELPDLILRPLAAISPSGFAALRSCPLRAVWAARSAPLLPRSPRTRLGTVVHHLWEAAASGRVPDEVTFDLAWQAEIHAQELEMKQDWKEAHLVPFSTSVSDLEVQRLRCRRQVTGWRQGSGRATLRTEQTFADATGIIKGRIDVIITDVSGTHLIDLKTGSITNADGTVKEDYAQQLKLYAVLYHHETGTWPATLALRTAEGEDCLLVWTPDECRALLAEALHLHAQINDRIREGMRGDTLAKPDPDTCRHCPFRPACPYYWQARRESNQEDWPMDVNGHVGNFGKLGNGRWKLRLIDGAETFHLRGLSPERHTFLAENLDEAAFYNLRCDGNGRYVQGPMTTGYST